MRYYYSNSINQFLSQPFEQIWAELTATGRGDLLNTQKQAWGKQIAIMQTHLQRVEGDIFFEYSVPRMGKRIDVVMLIYGIVFVLEFKVGANEYISKDINQVWDYALSLKYFHEESHSLPIVPILISTGAIANDILLCPHDDHVVRPILSNGSNISEIIHQSQLLFSAKSIDNYQWGISRYAPTPTIIEAAQALYNEHSVKEIARSEAKNLTATTEYVFKVIEEAKTNNNKVICFVTGVPGAGKTLVGLNISTQSMSKEGVNAVYLSGNGPLVKILVEALTRDKVRQIKDQGRKCTKKEVEQKVKSFIQNVHHFRDACLEGTLINNNEIIADVNYFRSDKNRDKSYAPIDHIVIFDEAQRAWTKDMTESFMSNKKNLLEFPYSEPRFLISCMDRHKDWALIVCLVGEGQEINTGEAGISEWINSLTNHFKDWHIHISTHLINKEYFASNALQLHTNYLNVFTTPELHLSVSLRSFRAEKLSQFVHHLLELNQETCKEILKELTQYPIVLTRDINKAKLWLKENARGNERYGIIVSSLAYRLRPLAIDVRVKPDPVHWFLSDKDDIRSSFYLEDVVTEFDIQGLELDYTCVVWDADFRYKQCEWGTYSFVGNKWQNIKKDERKMYLKNAYRVLLTRARQGMIIVVPEGDDKDHTRKPEYYDSTYNYLKKIGLSVL